MRNSLVVLGLWAALLAASFCCFNAEPPGDMAAFVSGKSQCLDCAAKNITTERIQVAIKCKNSKGGGYEVRGEGKLDEEGGYKVRIPTELIGGDGELKQECFAQLHGASNAPCPNENGMNHSKIALKSKEGGVHTFSTAADLRFSSATCASAVSFKIPPWIRWRPRPHPHPRPSPHPRPRPSPRPRPRPCPPYCPTMTAEVPKNPNSIDNKKPAHP